MIINMADLQQIFLQEAQELLEKMEPLVLELEKQAAFELLEELFRIMHTLKGSAGIAGIKGVGKLAHQLENLLENLREQRVAVTPDLIDLLLLGVDTVRAMLVDLAAGLDTMPPEELMQEIERQLQLQLAGQVSGVGGSLLTPGNAGQAPDTGQVRALIDNLTDMERQQYLEWLEQGMSLYLVGLQFGREFFRQGHNLGYLLEDLAGMGDIVKIIVDDSGIPPLSLLDPEDYHLELVLLMATAAGEADVQEVFAFVLDEQNRLFVHPLTQEDLSGTDRLASIRPEHCINILQQQARALQMAAEDVFPDLAASVYRVLQKMAQHLHWSWPGQPLAAGPAAREQLLGIIRELLLVVQQRFELSGTETAGSILLGDVKDGSGRQLPGFPAGSEKLKGSPGYRSQEYFKVRAETADALLRLTGELIIAKNSLPYLVKQLEAAGQAVLARQIKERYHLLDRIARDIQERVMEIWLLPIQEVFNRFPRFVREQARVLNKMVELEMSGGETSLDRNIIEEIYEPLLHMVRNALDHGIEEVEERQRRGKNISGTIRLQACRQGENVLIQVSDDGRGIDTAALARRALEQGLVSAEQLAEMNEQEKLRLIFLPGLSSKESISDLSGRGVGMDVVENTVRRLGGTVQVNSEPGQGTSFTLTLPFTMATSEVLLVRTEKGTYGLPLAAVQETVRVQKTQFKTVRGKPIVMLRGQVMPLLLPRLNDVSVPLEDEPLLVVLHNRAVWPVRAVLGREEVITQPLSGELKKIRLFSGAAVLGDGRVLLVIDPVELVNDGLSCAGSERK